MRKFYNFIRLIRKGIKENFVVVGYLFWFRNRVLVYLMFIFYGSILEYIYKCFFFYDVICFFFVCLFVIFIILFYLNMKVKKFWVI